MSKTNLTVDLIKSAQDREYTKFEDLAKEALKEKLQAADAFKELQKKLAEACNKKLKEEDDEKKDDEDDEGEEDKKDKEDKEGDNEENKKGKEDKED